MSTIGSLILTKGVKPDSRKEGIMVEKTDTEKRRCHMQILKENMMIKS